LISYSKFADDLIQADALGRVGLKIDPNTDLPQLLRRSSSEMGEEMENLFAYEVLMCDDIRYESPGFRLYRVAGSLKNSG
jgi:hypothetical protein